MCWVTIVQMLGYGKNMLNQVMNLNLFNCAEPHDTSIRKKKEWIIFYLCQREYLLAISV